MLKRLQFEFLAKQMVQWSSVQSGLGAGHSSSSSLTFRHRDLLELALWISKGHHYAGSGFGCDGEMSIYFWLNRVQCL